MNHSSFIDSSAARFHDSFEFAATEITSKLYRIQDGDRLVGLICESSAENALELYLLGDENVRGLIAVYAKGL